MIGEERNCIDILTQIGAVSTALESLACKLLDDHATHCPADALATGAPELAARKSRELLATIQRFRAHAMTAKLETHAPLVRAAERGLWHAPRELRDYPDGVSVRTPMTRSGGRGHNALVPSVFPFDSRSQA